MTFAVAPAAFSIRDAVTYTGLSRSNLYRQIGEGKLKSVKVGGRRMIQRAAIDAFFASLSQGEV